MPENKLDEIKELLKNVVNLELSGKLKEAINILERAIKLNPKDGNLFNRLGDLYIKMNKPKEALVAYQRGIEAFKNDNFLRNALALCKKVLRYDPGNVDINFTIAQLLIELDEKSDAAIYLFSYIERQMSAGNKKEVMRAMEILKNLKVSDRTMADKMATIYDTVGEKKKAEEVKQEPGEMTVDKPAEVKSVMPEIHPVLLEKKSESLEAKTIKQDIIDVESLNRLEKLTDEIERVTGDLRRAMRIDEVVIAVDKSLSIFSQQQKEAINLIYKSVQANLENLKKAIFDLQDASKKNINGIEIIVAQLNRSIIDINNNQKLIVQEIANTLNQIGAKFETTTQKMLTDLKNLTVCCETTSQNVCNKVEENRHATQSLLKISNETKVGIQNINETLLKYFLNQESRTKRLFRFIFVVICILSGITILLLISLLK